MDIDVFSVFVKQLYLLVSVCKGVAILIQCHSRQKLVDILEVIDIEKNDHLNEPQAVVKVFGVKVVCLFLC